MNVRWDITKLVITTGAGHRSGKQKEELKCIVLASAIFLDWIAHIQLPPLFPFLVVPFLSWKQSALPLTYPLTTTLASSLRKQPPSNIAIHIIVHPVTRPRTSTTTTTTKWGWLSPSTHNNCGSLFLHYFLFSLYCVCCPVKNRLHPLCSGIER